MMSSASPSAPFGGVVSHQLAQLRIAQAGRPGMEPPWVMTNSFTNMFMIETAITVVAAFLALPLRSRPPGRLPAGVAARSNDLNRSIGPTKIGHCLTLHRPEC